MAEESRQGMLSAVLKAKSVFTFKGEAAQKEDLVAAVESLRNSVMEAYPAYIDLPEWEPALLMLE